MVTGLEQVDRLSDEYRVGREDILLIGVNASGARSTLPYARARFRLRVVGHEDDPIYLILPLGRDDSPYELTAEKLLFDGQLLGHVDALENDDVVVGYFRKNQRVLTLNSNARSACTGCVFCPNVLEEASDPRLKALDDLNSYFGFLRAETGWSDLSQLEKITVCTGCFHSEAPAINHLALVREAASVHGFNGQLHLLSSVLRSDAGLARTREEVGAFHLTITIECFTDRDLVLKQSKADFPYAEMQRTLAAAKEKGFDADFTYIVGLDPLDVAIPMIEGLRESITTFPKIQIYQAHNAFMKSFAAPGATTMEFFLSARERLERVFRPTGLRPQSWENYRSLWYFSYDHTPHRTVRI